MACYDFDLCPDDVSDWDRVLIGDEDIHAGFAMCVRRLLRAGHTITVNRRRVNVSPPIHPQVLEWLDLDADLVAKILHHVATAPAERVH